MSTTKPTSARRRAHRHDPQTSHLAAEAVNESTATRVKDALVELLREQSAAPFEAQMLYTHVGPARGWPKIQPHSVNRRLSELKRDGFIRGTGELVRTPDGANAERLALTEAVAA